MQKLILVVFIVLSAGMVRGQNITPKIRDVVKAFYGTYTTDELDYKYVAFEKRKGDWWVVTQKVVDKELVADKKYHFYNKGLKKFMPLSLDKRNKKEEVKPEEYVEWYDLRNYDLQPYFGYSGWYKDVITDLENKPKRSDDELYVLGRAYGAYAGGLVSDASGYAVKEEIWSLPFGINSLSSAQIDKFHSIAGKAIQCFKELSVKNPEYETVVGKIGMKYANEVMFQYQVLLAYADKYAATLNLPKDLYPEEQLETAKKNLESCPPNAILVSFGDNDYYPVHYLQNARGIRKDVHLINYSLMAVDRYIYRATFPLYESKGIKLSVDTSLYAGNKNDIIYLKDSAFSFMASDIARLLRSEPKADYDRVILSAKEILLSNDTAMVTGDMSIGTRAVVSLQDARYLLKSQWILLDIIENLNGRKICFQYFFEDELKGLSNHLIRQDDIWIYNND